MIAALASVVLLLLVVPVLCVAGLAERRERA